MCIFKPRYLVDLSTTALLFALVAHPEPRGFKYVAKFPEWLSTMQEEIDTLKSNYTWDLVPRPLGTNIVGSKWFFQTKYYVDGFIEHHKARLVAPGFAQI